jgi:hypothetical protein
MLEPSSRLDPLVRHDVFRIEHLGVWRGVEKLVVIGGGGGELYISDPLFSSYQIRLEYKNCWNLYQSG